MSVSNRIREVEREIDANICQLRTWQGPRTEVLSDLMHTYRDAIELAFLKALHAETFAPFDGFSEEFGAALGEENRLRAGSLWAIKWASEYCPESAASTKRTPKELVELLFLGATYETFVDALKYAQHNLITIKVDETLRAITFYEGGPLTAFDGQIVQHQRLTSPIIPHVSLTEDSDQLTSRWTAGDYRRVTKRIAAHAANEENTILVDPNFLTKIGKSKISIPQPTLVWLKRPNSAPDCYVFDDLVLPAFDDVSKWKLVSLLDTPIIQIGDRFCALSSDVKTIASIDDYMLRLAALVDSDQYSKVSTLREARMIKICRDTLKKCIPPWFVDEHVIYKDPLQEVDVLASRGANSLILQLKSTLRPETPWEVYKRNEDIIKGIKHTQRLLDRGVGNQGFVLTDGYWGDYACWSEALLSNIPIATLYDVESIAADPILAVSEMKNRIGIVYPADESLLTIPDREGELMGWTLRFIDSHSPENTDK
ncbi:MAG: hypothetical protein JW927_14405 [Deltaproteobacteria bacterium]|nr:hypothetical protein [Deltaproteobacteria bacterium]